MKAYPDDLRLKRKLMQMLFLRAQAQDRERALGILTALEERLPQDTELLAVRAAQILKEPAPQSLGTIREKLESALRLEPAAVNAHLALIAVAMRQGELKAACDFAVQALASNPNNPALLSARARAELALGYIPMAVKLASEALAQDPRNVEALNVIVDGALISRDRSLLEQARTLVDSALGREPANEELLIQRSHVLAALELPQMAIASLDAYCRTKEGSGSVRALVTLADMHRLAGDAERAREWIEQAERLDRGNLTVVHARFLWLVSQKRLDELANISSAYLSAKQQDPATLLKAASTLLSLDRKDLQQEAVKLFEHAATLAPTSLDVHLGLASSLYQTGDAEGAEKIYRQLLERYPNEIRASQRPCLDSSGTRSAVRRVRWSWRIEVYAWRPMIGIFWIHGARSCRTCRTGWLTPGPTTRHLSACPRLILASGQSPCCNWAGFASSSTTWRAAKRYSRRGPEDRQGNQRVHTRRTIGDIEYPSEEGSRVPAVKAWQAAMAAGHRPARAVQK